VYRRRLLACLQTHGSRANWHPHLAIDSANSAEKALDQA
jgi:hypothetical protein